VDFQRLLNFSQGCRPRRLASLSWFLNLEGKLGFTILDAIRLYPKVTRTAFVAVFKGILNRIAYELDTDIVLTAHHLEDFLVRML
jgi:hypothetical protein